MFIPKNSGNSANGVNTIKVVEKSVNRVSNMGSVNSESSKNSVNSVSSSTSISDSIVWNNFVFSGVNERVTQKDEPWEAKEVGHDEVEKIAPYIALVDGVTHC